MKLLLFDIDNTLVSAPQAGRHALEETLSSLAGQPISSEGVSFGGKTDPQIVEEILAANDVSAESTARMLPRALEAYAERAQDAIRQDGVAVLPGVRDLVTHLDAHDEVQLGLLTGNLESVAYEKLRAAGLDHFFPVGAFGSDDKDRYELPPIALQRAEAHTGQRFEGRDTIIIGDTKHDVLCGRRLDVLAVGVCTGRRGKEAFSDCTPDVILEDLSDLHLFVRKVLRPRQA